MNNKMLAQINSYSFGRIKIDNKEYDYDVMITKDNVIKWWRKQGHYMGVSDITSYVDLDQEKPEIIVIGKGQSGMMEVSNEVKKFIEDKNIKLIIKKTTEAVNDFNKSKNKNQIGFFHLTC